MTTKDRIKGAVFGFAVGDALGLGAEFFTKNEIRAYYPDGLRSFDGFVRDAHRSQWERGEYTNDTVYFTAMAETIMRIGGFDILECAKDLHRQYIEHSYDLTPVIRAIVMTPGWADNPIEKATEAWKEHGLTEASNEAVGRGLLAGIMASGHEIYDWTRPMAMMTNPDSRCVCSAMVIAKMANSILHDHKPADYNELLAISYATDSRISAFLDKAHNGTIADLELDDENTCCWTRKSMASALWAIWHCDSASECIYSVANEGGDADSNAALAGALAGLLYGYDALPDLKDQLVNREYLLDFSDRLTDYVESNCMK